jgi:LysR family glycine cleavage system transcriptional activator
MHASHFEQSGDPRLIRLFPNIRCDSPYRYYFVCRPRALQTRSVRIFRDWLVAANI